MEDEELVAALDDQDNELDRLDPLAEEIKLRNGLEVRILPLRTRQLFKLLRIITHGAGAAVMQSGIDFGEEPGVFLQKLVSLVLFSIPDAEQEAIDFLQAMVEPTGLIDKPPRALTDKEREHNTQAWTDLNMELWNPDPSDTVDIIEMIVHRESGDLQALGKRLRQFLQLAQKTGQLRDKNSSKAGPRAPTSQVNLPEPSTSSSPSTGGPTGRSSTSRSAGSGRSSRQSTRGTGKKSAPAGA